MRWGLLGCGACFAVACSLDLRESEIRPSSGGTQGAGAGSSSSAGQGATSATSTMTTTVSTTMSTSTSMSTSTASGCTPHCPMGACSDDGCNGTCPGCVGDMECDQGSCVACAPWTVTPMGVVTAGRLALDGDTLYAGGAITAPTSPGSWVGSFDTCNGKVLASNEYAGPRVASVGQIPLAQSSTRVFFAGGQVNDGAPFLGGAPKGAGANWKHPVGTDGTSFIADVAAGADGNVWATGIDGTPPSTWILRALSDGSNACVYDDVTGVGGFAVTNNGADVVIASSDGADDLVLARYADTDCDATSTCAACSPSTNPKTSPIGTLTGVVATQATSLGLKVFVVGRGLGTDGKTAGFVARFASTLVLEDVFTFHPSMAAAKNDTLNGVTVGARGTSLYVVGGTAIPDIATSATGNGVILQLSPLDFSIAPVQHDVTATVLESVQASSTALFVAGTRAGAAVVKRCSPDGSCP